MRCSKLGRILTVFPTTAVGGTPIMRVTRQKKAATIVWVALVVALGVGLISREAYAGDLPDYMRVVSPAKQQPGSARAVAEKNVLALDTAMQSIYQDSLAKYKPNLRDQVPIILALFSEGGGRLILYRPGKEPLEAEPVPIVYQLAKSCSHSSMAVYQLVAPYLSDPSDKSWRGPMEAYRARNQTVLDGLDALELKEDQRNVLRAILRRNIAFMDNCLKKGTFTFEELEKFAHDFKPYFEKTIWMAADAQVGHWMKVLDEWKEMLGKDWERTYAATNTLYVTRQNNILFSILVQYMGEEAINDRLLLFETTAFTTTPEQMLDLLTRIVSDRSLGKVFFRDYYLMDYELVGSGARRAIEEEVTKRGRKPILPSLVPFHSNEWPWHTDPKTGKGPATLEEIK